MKPSRSISLLIALLLPSSLSACGSSSSPDTAADSAAVTAANGSVDNAGAPPGQSATAAATGTTGADNAGSTTPGSSAITNPDGTYLYAYDQLEVFIKPDASEADIKTLDQKIRSYPGVLSVFFISKDEAMGRLRDSLEGHEDVLKSLQGNPLPPSVLVAVDSGDEMHAIIRDLAGNPAVDNTPGTDDGFKTAQVGISQIVLSGTNYQIVHVSGVIVDSGTFEIKGNLLLFNPAGGRAAPLGPYSSAHIEPGSISMGRREFRTGAAGGGRASV